MIRAALASVGVAALLGACVMQTDMPEPEEGAGLFAENCALCHGADGRGGGSYAASLGRAVPDLTRLTRRAGGAFPRAAVMSQIDGYTRAQLPGQDMPEFGLLLRGETVPIDSGDGVLTPTPRPLAALMVYLESIQR